MSHVPGPGSGPDGFLDHMWDTWGRVRHYRPKMPLHARDRYILLSAALSFLAIVGVIILLFYTSVLSGKVDKYQGEAKQNGHAAQANAKALSTANGKLSSAGIAAVPTPKVSFSVEPGPTGPPGVNGSAGGQGVQGSQGETGSSGATGPAGAQGPQGAQGGQGGEGPQGPQGAQGAAGANGQDGANGANGQAGSPPASFSFTTITLTGPVTYVCTPNGDSGPGTQPTYSCAAQ